MDPQSGYRSKIRRPDMDTWQKTDRPARYARAPTAPRSPRARRESQPLAPIRDLSTGQARLRNIRSSCDLASESFYMDCHILKPGYDLSFMQNSQICAVPP